MANNRIDYSIHPRNDYMRDPKAKKGEKTNTCAPRNDSRKGTLAFREKARGARRTAMTSTMANSKNPAAYTVPGSMRGW